MLNSTSTNSTVNEVPDVAAKSPFTFETGDVRIKVTCEGKCIIGSVSSAAMILASPVWNKFIHPPWEEVKNPAASNKEKEIDCSEDNAHALLILLNIAHLRFDLVPNRLLYFDLYKVAVLVDQYQCVKLVKPWLAFWLTDEEIQSKQAGQEGWLFIAWVFGRDKVFEELSAHLVRTATSNASGKLLSIYGTLLPEPLPPGIIESIYNARKETVTKLLNIPYSQISLYEASNAKVCQQGGDKEKCDAISYGSLALGLRKNNLWPRITPDAISRSKWTVTLMASIISTLTVLVAEPSSHPYGPRYEHTKCCDSNFKVKVEEVMSNIASPVLDSHRVHMKGQRGERP